MLNSGIVPEIQFSIKFQTFKEFFDFVRKRGEYHAPANSTPDILNKHLENVCKEMIDTISRMPHLKDIGGLIPVYNIIKAVAISTTGVIIAYKGVKIILSTDDIREKKDVFGRLGYSMVFCASSIEFIDIMISLNNALIQLITSHFKILPFEHMGKSYGIIISVLMILAQLYALIKIMIEFWMRMAELVFLGTISPLVFVLWINNEWAGYLRQWWKRVAVLIFSQFVQILMLVVYSMLMSGLLLTGTFNGICLSLGILLLMSNTPRILSQFSDTNGVAIKTISKIKKFIKR